MCLNPRFIRKRNFRYLKDSRKIYVPCGECLECQRSKQNDLFVRAKMEYDSCLRAGGNGFMCCLTYMPNQVPTIYIEGKPCYVFNKKDVIDFIKRLRVNLDREYNRRYGFDAPDFKYLITSEYGTDPTRTHRPHYHLLFFFRKSIEPTVFIEYFRRSTYSVYRDFGKDCVKRYFGYIMQCDLLRPEKGGILYSCKYVCKDATFKKQNDFLDEKIRFYKDYVNHMHGIIDDCKSAEDDFKNTCIRASKAYRDDVAIYVRPYRHMKQFYMCSNDLGGSCVVERYKGNLVNIPLVSIDGFPYKLPTIVKQKFEKEYGFAKLQELQKNSFLKHLSCCLEDCVNRGFITQLRSNDLYLFANQFIQPYKGHLTLILPNFDPLVSFRKRDFESFANILSFYDDNDFFEMRDALQNILSLYNDDENVIFRFRIIQTKIETEKKNYEQKKRNKNV